MTLRINIMLLQPTQTPYFHTLQSELDTYRTREAVEPLTLELQNTGGKIDNFCQSYSFMNLNSAATVLQCSAAFGPMV